MKKTLKIGLAIALVLAMSLAVAGCTSNTSTSSNTSGQALTITATKIPVNATIKSYYGDNTVGVNATLSNNKAGTFKFSSDDFFLRDSSGQINQPLGTATTGVSDSGYDSWIHLYFQVKQGSTPATLRYYDGTHDVSSSMS